MKLIGKALTFRVDKMIENSHKIIMGLLVLVLLFACVMSDTGLYSQITVKKTAALSTASVGVTEQPDFILQYDESAPRGSITSTGTDDEWAQQSNQIGNGNIGATIFGGVDEDIIMVNEASVWSGGPGADTSYDGGLNDSTAETNKATLYELQGKIQDMVDDYVPSYFDSDGNLVTSNYTDSTGSISSDVSKLYGEKTNFGEYQSLSDIIITDESSDETSASDYLRTLNLNNAVANVSYSKGSANYNREYFVSYPDNYMAIKYTADGGTLNKTISLDTPQTNSTISASGNSITFTGSPADHDESERLIFVQQLRVVSDGEISSSSETLYVSGATEFTIYMTAQTNYQAYYDEVTSQYDFFKDENTASVLESRLDDIIAKANSLGYDNLKQAHIDDYKEYFDRVVLSLDGATMPDKMTDDLLSDYNSGTNTDKENRYLEMLYYQFGRYLLIASSREDTLPANLQGIWASGLDTPWNSDYHTNINVQMNYWLSDQTNLSELQTPLIDYINLQIPRGEETAEHYHAVNQPWSSNHKGDVRGWTLYHENNIWANTAPGTSSASYYPVAAAWLCEHIYDSYAYSMDLDFLEENYKTMEDAAIFWVDSLVMDYRDGTLVASPSYSPEHGPVTLGSSNDQAVIWELYRNVINSANALGYFSYTADEVRESITYNELTQEQLKQNEAGTAYNPYATVGANIYAGISEEYENTASGTYLSEIIHSFANLSDPRQIGLGGEYLEWKDEQTLDITGDSQHRHTNHLYALHPSSLVVAGRSEQDDLWVDAMKETLEIRGDGGTGWSMGWKINFWARLRDGDHAHTLIQNLFDSGTYSSLLDTHSPFQIDGNFGATAGMTEMLLQSQGDSVDLLAAIPSVWGDGSVYGLKARGNVEVDMVWEDGGVVTANLKPAVSNSALKVKAANIGTSTITDSDGNRIYPTVIDSGTIVLDVTAGEVYTVSNFRDCSALYEMIESASELLEDFPEGSIGYNVDVNAVLQDAITAAEKEYSNADGDSTSLQTASDTLQTALDKFYLEYEDYMIAASLSEGTYYGAQEVQLSIGIQGAKIYYTLDGSEPTLNSRLYTSSIYINDAETTLRAIISFGGVVISNELSKQYQIIDKLSYGSGYVESTSSTINGYASSNMFDGDYSTRSATRTTSYSVTYTFDEQTEFDTIEFNEFVETDELYRMSGYTLSYLSGNSWIEFDTYDVDNVASNQTQNLNENYSVQLSQLITKVEPITTKSIKMELVGSSITIWEIEIYRSFDGELESIQPISDIVGLDNGVEKNENSLGLPSTVKLNLKGETYYNVGSVEWDVENCSYDLSNSSSQTFDVSGTVSIPENVYNSNSINLQITVTITVDAKENVGSDDVGDGDEDVADDDVTDDEVADDEVADEDVTDGESDKEESGCGSAISASEIGISVIFILLIAAFSLILRKKYKQNK